MTQLRRDAAYVRTETRHRHAPALTAFDEEVCDLLSTPHTVISAAKTLARTDKAPAGRAPDDREADLESRVADAMVRLLQAEHIELSPDS
jgi:hypothetical protein